MPSSGVQTCARSEEHTSELQSHDNLVCRLLLEKKSSVFWPILLPGLSPGLVFIHVTARTLPNRASCGLVVRRVPRAGLRGVEPQLFFFKYRPPPKTYPLPLPAALPT